MAESEDGVAMRFWKGTFHSVWEEQNVTSPGGEGAWPGYRQGEPSQGAGPDHMDLVGEGKGLGFHSRSGGSSVKNLNHSVM